MIEELSEEYLPEIILHRDEQLNQIKEIFQNFKKNKIGTNAIIFGVTGSGKTTIIKKIIKDEGNAIYVSCDETNTAFKTIKSFLNINSKTLQEVLQLTIKELKKSPKIIILDEVDKVSRAEEFSKLMSNLNTIYRKTMIPIILITLRRDIISLMKSDVRKTLFFDKINLPSYNAIELKDILQSRIKNLKLELDEGTIMYISALAGQQGSARLLMNMALRCLQKDNFSKDFIEESYKQLMKEDWLDFVHDINNTEKEFLRNLLIFCEDEKEISAEEIENKMGLSCSRISQLINTFEKYAIIKSWHENLGRRGGRKRIIKFSSKEVYEELDKIIPLC